LARRSCGFGEGSAQEQSVVGARLQALAEPDAVVIAAGTHRLIGDLFDYRDLGAVDVKGIAAPVPAWQVLRPSVVVSRFEALRGSALTRLVGREEEIDLMLRRWARAKAGDGQVVLISGEAGLGKSRLTAALVERSTPSHISACAISARPIIRTAHCSHSLTSSTGRRGLSAMICLRPNWGRSKPCWLTPLAQTKTWRFSRTFCPYRWGSGTDAQTQPAAKERTLEALIHQLESLARGRPVLVVFEGAGSPITGPLGQSARALRATLCGGRRGRESRSSLAKGGSTCSPTIGQYRSDRPFDQWDRRAHGTKRH
jgi:hypothetical protein